MSFARWPLHAVRSALLCGALLTACSSDDNGPPDEPGTPVRISFCAGEAPVWLAVQDGDAAWKQVTPRITGVYDAGFTANRGGVAYVSSGGSDLVVAYGDLTELAMISCPLGTKSINGSVAGLTAAEGSDIWLGVPLATANAQRRFQFRDVAEGQQDLFATRFTRDGNGGQIANRLVIRRAQLFTSGSRLPTIDFASTESFAPAFATVSVANADDAPTVGILSSWHGQASTTLVMYGTAPGPQLYSAVPEDQLRPGELSSLQAFADGQTGVRSATEYFRAPTDRVVTLGPVLSTPVLTWPGAPAILRPRLQLPSQTEYGRMAYATYNQGALAVRVFVTSSWLGGTPATWDIQVPDLSSVEGWNDAWGFTSSNVLWYATAEGGVDRSLGDVVNDGDVFRTADFNGSSEAAGRASRVIGRKEPHRGGFTSMIGP